MSTDPAPSTAETEKETPPPKAPPPVFPFRPNWKMLAGFAVLCGIAVAFTFISTVPHVIPEAGVSMDLPDQVLGLRGTEQEISEAELKILPKDTEFAKKVYSDETGNSISCQIVLSGGDRRSIHRPEACLPGQGWNMLSNEPVTIDLESGNQLTVQKLRLSREVQVAQGQTRTLPMLFLYWYVGSNKTTHDQMSRILYSNLDLLMNNRVHRWAYVIVSAPVLQGFTSDGLNETNTLERLKDFIRESVPQFQKSEMQAVRVEKAAGA